MTKRQLLLMVIWFCCYIASLQFFRFRFGFFPISIAFLIIGYFLMLLFGGPKKSKAP